MEGQLIPLVLVAGLIVFMAFEFGRLVATAPDDDEMIRRLIAKRVQRRMQAITVKDVDRELDDAAAKITAR